MKSFWLGLISLLMCCMSAPASAQAAASTETAMGTHGMALFGGHEGLYASHLPMFHAPHDTQVVFRFHLQDAVSDAQLREALALKSQLWTLEPEPFDLLRIQIGHPNRLTEFATRIVEGHFERGGVEKFANQTAVIDEVLYFKRLSGAQPATTEGHYHLIGKNSEWFLFKEIDRRPDVDTIIALNRRATTPECQLPTTITLLSQELAAPSGEMVDGALQKQAGGCFTLRGVLYVETGDLE